MAHIRRLIWFLVGVMLVGAPMLAFADGGWFHSGTANRDCTTPTCTQAAAIEAARVDVRMVVGSTNAKTTIIGTDTEGCTSSQPCLRVRVRTEVSCLINGSWSNCINTSNVRYVYQFVDLEAQCVAGGGNWYGGQCITCTPGYTWTGTECKNPCESKAGNSYGTSDSWAAVSSAGGGGSTFCDGTCAVQATATECTRSGISGAGDFVSLGESCVMRGPFKITGTTCGGDGTYPTLDYVEQQERPWWESGSDEKGCQATGGYWGQVNGIDACVAPQPGETVQNETTTTPAEGNKNTTTNPDGSTTETTTKETTSTDGGKATTTKETTTIYRNPDGSIANQETKTETSEQPLSEFCKTNPAHPSCVGTKTDGSFAGSCSGGFKCSGDAVQCAIAEAVHKQRCDAAQAETEASDFLQQVGLGTIDAAKVSEALNSDGAFDFDIFQAFEDARQNYISFAAECLPPLGFEFKGQSYTFDVQFICEIGDFVRVMLHIMAYSAVLGLISRAFGG